MKKVENECGIEQGSTQIEVEKNDEFMAVLGLFQHLGGISGKNKLRKVIK